MPITNKQTITNNHKQSQTNKQTNITHSTQHTHTTHTEMCRKGPVVIALFALCIVFICQQFSLVVVLPPRMTTTTTTTTTSDTGSKGGGGPQHQHERMQMQQTISISQSSSSPVNTVTTFISAAPSSTTISSSSSSSIQIMSPLPEKEEVMTSTSTSTSTVSRDEEQPDRRIPLEFPWSPLLDSWEPPKWITEYMDWHAHIRSTHPAFFSANNTTNNNNQHETTTLPPLLIVHCTANCGGLHDRLGSLPFDLYLANQTKRLLLYAWDRPMDLEHFLVPNRLNWSLEGFPRDHPHLVKLSNAPSLFDLYQRGDKGTDEILWNETLPNAIRLALNHTIPVFTTPLRTHNGEFFLESILKGLGETDMIHTTPTFGWIWQSIFQPSSGLTTYMEQMRHSMNLTKGQYIAIHCRLHYPTMLEEQAKGIPLQTLHGPGSIDRVGMKLEGRGKEFAVAVGIHAVQCARTLAKKNNSNNNSNNNNDDADVEPLYFFSDANNLVQYMSQSNHTGTHYRSDEFHVDESADQVLSKVRLVVRPDIHERNNHHLDYHHSSNPHDFYATFADLYLAMEARCITFGYGGFGRFAQQLTNTTCYLQHQLHIHSPFYGHSLNMYENVCTKESYANLSQFGSSS